MFLLIPYISNFIYYVKILEICYIIWVVCSFSKMNTLLLMSNLDPFWKIYFLVFSKNVHVSIFACFLLATESMVLHMVSVNCFGNLYIFILLSPLFSFELTKAKELDMKENLAIKLYSIQIFQNVMHMLRVCQFFFLTIYFTENTYLKNSSNKHEFLVRFIWHLLLTSTCFFLSSFYILFSAQSFVTVESICKQCFQLNVCCESENKHTFDITL